MNLIKLKFSNSNTDSTLTGNGTSSEPFGINFNGITGLEPYSERLLFSAELSGVSSIDLSEPKNHFERLRFVIGARNWSNNGLESKEFGTEPNNIHLNFQNGAGGNAYWVGTYGTWTTQSHLDVSKSKNVYGSYSNANITGNLTYSADDINCIKAVYGVNPKPIRTLRVIDGGHGTISADTSAGIAGEVCTLSNTPDQDWYFSGYNITGATLTGNKFTFGNSDVIVEGVWSDTPQIKTLTLQTDGHGTLTANKVTGFEGDTVTLTPTYSNYYRFSAYQTTGGTVNGNTYTFGTAQEQTAKANFKVNAFTATGNWEKGSNVSVSQNASYATTANVPAKYALHGAHTGDIPAAWYSTSNRWKVTSTVSGYKITLNPIMKFQINNDNASVNAYATACSLIGSTQTQTASWSYGKNSKTTATYSKSFTSNSTGVNYGISAKIQANGYMSTQNYYGRCTYLAAQTTGTWTATGYAP